MGEGMGFTYPVAGASLQWGYLGGSFIDLILFIPSWGNDPI